MGRPIDADALLKQIEDDSAGNEGQYGDEWQFIDTIKNMPTIDAPKWIPCSERLPSKEEQDIDLGVLVTLGNGYKGMDFDWYHDGRWYDWGNCVIAWMPLPKLWEGADDE